MPDARAQSMLRTFMRSEAAGGMLLMATAAIALVIANSPLSDSYFAARDYITGPILTPKLGPMTIHLWINDLLMAVFFFVVGLEVKREFLDGHLTTWADRRLPLIAALGGMVLPALVFIFVVGGTSTLVRGWAIPAATDIAFALGLLALLGSRVPASLKLFLTTVAIIDDMGAVTIIALFYTSALTWWALGAAVVVLAAMAGMNRAGLRHPAWFLAGFAVLWYFMLLSGVHATIAGVLAALAVPLPITPMLASVANVSRAFDAFGPDARYVVVRNLYGCDANSFDLFDQPLMKDAWGNPVSGNAKARLAELGGKIIDLPRLDTRTYARVDALGLSVHAAMEHPELPLSQRMSLRNWLKTWSVQLEKLGADFGFPADVFQGGR